MAAHKLIIMIMIIIMIIIIIIITTTTKEHVISLKRKHGRGFERMCLLEHMNTQYAHHEEMQMHHHEHAHCQPYL